MLEGKSETLLRRQTDPLWLQDYFLAGGSDEGTTSATITFVSRKGRPYGVTCRHVVDELPKEAARKGIKFPVLALKANRTVLNLASWTVSVLKTSFLAPPDADIAITPLDAFWPTLSQYKNKALIDLDHWREPDWSKMKWGGAAGYPNEHKYLREEDGITYVANPFMRSVAAVASRLGPAERVITLSSQLDKPHSWYFSGLSGGPLCLMDGVEGSSVEDEDVFPAGIVFEGFPASGRLPASQGNICNAAFLDGKDLFFRAHTLTPEIFDEWLETALPITDKNPTN